ncbi:MAG: CDP-archaeol synthase, partial [Bacteroidota bacterium]|nr:CDP-archaeol synthase [Bacteroidota bacterium]
GAYFVGVSVGKRNIFASISPKKTLEGTIGGIVFGIMIGVAVYYVLNIFELIDWIIMSVLISVSAFIGDLVESKIKRSVNIKDSGNIMPGHGGVLDRFDSFLFAIIAVSLYSVFFI